MLQPRFGRNGTRNKKKFFTLFQTSDSIYIEMKPKWLFGFFYYFFGNSPTRVRLKHTRNKIFFLIFFSACPGSVWLEMNSEWHFLKKKFEFFVLFFRECSILGWEKRYSKRNFFWSLFWLVLAQFFLYMRPKLCFLIFWIFILFFWECSSPGRVGTELGMKILLFVSQHV